MTELNETLLLTTSTERDGKAYLLLRTVNKEVDYSLEIMKANPSILEELEMGRHYKIVLIEQQEPYFKVEEPEKEDNSDGMGTRLVLENLKDAIEQSLEKDNYYEVLQEKMAERGLYLGFSLRSPTMNGDNLQIDKKKKEIFYISIIEK